MQSDQLPRILLFVALIGAGLLAGAPFGIWRGYDPRGLEAAAFVAVHQEAVRGLNVLLPALGFVTIASLAVAAFLLRRERPALWLLLAALVLMAASGSITRFFNQPINAVVMGWSTTSVPANWQELRESWWYWHVARTMTTFAGFGLIAVTVLFGRQDTSKTEL
jgi:uncharacterized membrane protein